MKIRQFLRTVTLLTATALASATELWGCGGWFEEAPPLLPLYLDRLPAKSFGDIYLATRPPAPALPPPTAQDVLALADQLTATGDSRPKLLAQVDALLSAARSNYQDAIWCNLLNDVRDALAASAANNDTAEYLRWRVANMDWFFPLDAKPYDYPPVPPAANPARAQELEKRAAEAPAALRPQWLYLRGALGFAAGDREECAAWFERLIKEFADHPRAESGLFLLGRCALSQSRGDLPYEANLTPAQLQQRSREHEEKQQEKRAKSRQIFTQYLTSYPQGRFVADVHGWLGALDYRENKFTDALRNYIAQFETPEHPEVAKSSLFMCEKILSNVATPEPEMLALLAQHPVAAMGATYLILNSADVPSGNEPSEDYTTRAETARARKWRRETLPPLAAAVADNQQSWQDKEWTQRYLALLAESASLAGEQEVALKLTSRPAFSPPTDGGDDLLLARGVALQRASRSIEAIAVYDDLLQHFPTSPLVRGVRLKRALALQDHHEAGRAILELKKLREEIVNANPDATESYSESVYPPGDAQLTMSDSAVNRNITGVEIPQIDQIIDTLYNFAPVQELAAALDDKAADEALRFEFRAVAAQRLLADEKFADAQRFMTPAQFELGAANIEVLTRKAAAAQKPKPKALAALALGDAWAAQRGKLLKDPLDGGEAVGVFNSEDDQAALRRRENGQALGFPNTNEILESRDELRHALHWWARAAQDWPGTSAAATAQWKVLKSIPELAQASGFAFQRAIETDAASESKRLYELLRQENPDSIGARKYAAYWSFPPFPQDSNSDDFPKFDKGSDREKEAVGLMGYQNLDYSSFGMHGDFSEWDYRADFYKDRPAWQEIESRIRALPTQVADFDAKQMADEVDAIRQQVLKVYSVLGQASYLNFLDDLTLFLKEPNLSKDTVAAYLDLRLHFNHLLEQTSSGEADSYQSEVLPDQPALQGVADYVDFIRAAAKVKGNEIKLPTADIDKNGDPVVFQTTDYRPLEQGMRDFLKEHPKSAKREAAELVLARAVHWQTTPIITSLDIRVNSGPSAAQTASHQTVRRIYWREPFNPRRALAPLNAYDRDFPNGRYAAQIRDWRASACYQAHEWAKALDLTLAELEDTAHPDLQPEAALRLANIFAQLADEHFRSDLIEIIRSRPPAELRLQQFLATSAQYGDHPLRFLAAYLRAKLNLVE